MARGTSNNLGGFITFTAGIRHMSDTLIARDVIEARLREDIRMFLENSDSYSNMARAFFLFLMWC